VIIGCPQKREEPTLYPFVILFPHSNIGGVTNAAETFAPSYADRMDAPVVSGSRPTFVRSNLGDAASQRAWSLALPHDLIDGRIVDGPAPVYPPHEGFRRLFAVDPGETYRHQLSSVYGIKDAASALEAANDRLRLAGHGNAAYRDIQPLLQHLMSQEPGSRPSSAAVLSAVDNDRHHVVVPFLQDLAHYALPENPPADLMAWEVSVALRILWLAHGGGLFTDTVACNDLTLDGLSLIQDNYRTWRDYADALVVGRAVSTGTLDESSISFVEQVSTALNHPDSPWSQLPLHESA
jgi:hypothetical protein